MDGKTDKPKNGEANRNILLEKCDLTFNNSYNLLCYRSNKCDSRFEIQSLDSNSITHEHFRLADSRVAILLRKCVSLSSKKLHLQTFVIFLNYFAFFMCYLK